MCTANLRKFKTHKEIKKNGDHYRHFYKKVEVVTDPGFIEFCIAT